MVGRIHLILGTLGLLSLVWWWYVLRHSPAFRHRALNKYQTWFRAKGRFIIPRDILLYIIMPFPLPPPPPPFLLSETLIYPPGIVLGSSTHFPSMKNGLVTSSFVRNLWLHYFTVCFCIFFFFLKLDLTAGEAHFPFFLHQVNGHHWKRGQPSHGSCHSVGKT